MKLPSERNDKTVHYICPGTGVVYTQCYLSLQCQLLVLLQRGGARAMNEARKQVSDTSALARIYTQQSYLHIP